MKCLTLILLFFAAYTSYAQFSGTYTNYRPEGHFGHNMPIVFSKEGTFSEIMGNCLGKPIVSEGRYTKTDDTLKLFTKQYYISGTSQETQHASYVIRKGAIYSLPLGIKYERDTTDYSQILTENKDRCNYIEPRRRVNLSVHDIERYMWSAIEWSRFMKPR